MPRHLLLAAVAFLASAAPLAAATSYPMLMSIQPVAIQVGTTAEMTLKSRYSMNNSSSLLISGEGVTAEVLDHHSKLAEPLRPTRNRQRRPETIESLRIRVQAQKNALPGIRDFRIAGPYGASTLGQLVVVQDPVVMEHGNNDSIQNAQPIPLPAAVCGAIEKPEDRDCYKFHAQAGRSLVFRVRGMQLENRIHDLQFHLDPILTLRSPTGATLAVCDNDISGDPILCQRFDQDGDYTLEIRDVRYNGNRDWAYCIEINDRPFVRNVWPMGVRAGQHVRFQAAGFQLADSAEFEWTVPESWPLGFRDAQFPLKSGESNAVPLVVTDLPLIPERRGAHDTVKTAHLVPAPVGINGRIEKGGETDVYAFHANQGETFTFEVVSRRRGSPLDSILRVLNAKGIPLREGDDLSDIVQMSADAIIENWRAPAGGSYAVEVRDLLDRGGPDYVYFLKIARAEPGFDLYLDTDKTELAPGSRAAIFVNAIRRNGFNGEISLIADGLPEGVMALCSRIPPNHRDGCIILSATAAAKPSIRNLIVTGKSIQASFGAEARELSAVAVPLQEVYLPGGGRGHVVVESHAVAVGEPGDLRNVKLNKDAIILKPGGSVRVDVTIDRAPGFVDNVTLSPLFAHLSRVFGDTLPKGVTVDGKHSKTLLTGGETHGFITFQAAPNVEPTEKRIVSVMANVSINFVMKETFSSEPLFITTLAR